MLGYATPMSAPPVTVTPVAVAPVVVYGNRWCGITQLVRRYLDRAGVPYRYVDLDTHPAEASRLRWLAGGALRNPVVYVNGEWLEQPTLRELEWLLMRHRLL